MPSMNNNWRKAILLPAIIASSALIAQSGTVESPYSAFGLGDMTQAVRAPQGAMGGAGIAFTEPFAILSDNPASYSGLQRPTFDLSILAESVSLRSANASARRSQASFMGFSLGVPFARGRWGLALGLNPMTDVSYEVVDRAATEVGEVVRSYTGTGGLDKVFAGLSRTVNISRADTLGNLGNRLRVGANFNFLFGSVEQTRDAVYPIDGAYNQFRSFSSLLLRAPTGEFGLQWEGDITRRTKRDGNNWRYGIGATMQLPVSLGANYSISSTTYGLNAAGTETVRDSIQYIDGARGTVDVPMGMGFGFSVYDQRWMFTAEMRYRDWGASAVNVPGRASIGQLRAANTLIAAARFTPSNEGGLFKRTTYRAGVRYAQEYQVVNGQGLDVMALTAGLSLPLNALQTNSHLNLGVELGQRGTTSNGLYQERYAALWVGLSITPWKGERWLQPYRIQ